VSARATDTNDATRTASGAAIYTVRAPLASSVTTDRAIYARGDTALASALVTSGGAAAAGVTVSFQFRKADGRVVSASAVTNATGTAVAKLSIKRRDPLGAYQVTATVTGVTPVSAPFTVQ
jgi:hypothetical protein